MPDDIDWSLTTFEGNRDRQHKEFQALSFREKLKVLEQLGEVAAHFAARRKDAARAEDAPSERQGGPGAGG